MFEDKDKTWDAVCSYACSQQQREVNVHMIVAFMNMYMYDSASVCVCVYEVVKGIR